ncbi:MAG: hypothetical protein ACXVXZ_10360 [Mycobacteriaceae bacterium]
MADNDSAKRTGTLVALLAASVVLILADFLFLGIAITFGPAGFGGDGTISTTRALIENSGQTAGFIALLLGGVAVIWAVIGTLVIKSGHARNRGLKWIVGTQLVATAVLVFSTH